MLMSMDIPRPGLLVATLALSLAACGGRSPDDVLSCEELDRELSGQNEPRLVLCEDAEGNRIQRRLPAGPATPSVGRSPGGG